MIKFKEWISTGLITLIRNRERSFSKLKSRPFDMCLKQFYNMYKNVLNDLILKLK